MISIRRNANHQRDGVKQSLHRSRRVKWKISSRLLSSILSELNRQQKKPKQLQVIRLKPQLRTLVHFTKPSTRRIFATLTTQPTIWSRPGRPTSDKLVKHTLRIVSMKVGTVSILQTQRQLALQVCSACLSRSKRTTCKTPFLQTTTRRRGSGFSAIVLRQAVIPVEPGRRSVTRRSQPVRIAPEVGIHVKDMVRNSQDRRLTVHNVTHLCR